MTVAELIERLRRTDPQWPVFVDVGGDELLPVVGLATYDIPAAVVITPPHPERTEP